MPPKQPTPDLLATLEAFIDAVPDFAEYGTVMVRSRGQITLPKEVRAGLSLEEGQLSYLWGSPQLGLVLVMGQRRSPQEHFRFLQGGKRR